MAEIIYHIAFVIATSGIVLTLYRLIKGPTAADRIVALDVMTIISISVIVYISAMLQKLIYIDVALVYALISFLGVVALARYLERGL